MPAADGGSGRARYGARMQTLLPVVIIALLMVLAAPLWPWSKGWSWAPAGMLAMGLATMLLFQYAVVPES